MQCHSISGLGAFSIYTNHNMKFLNLPTARTSGRLNGRTMGPTRGPSAGPLAPGVIVAPAGLPCGSSGAQC